MTRVLVAMSGGVDSSVTAALLSEQGFECLGVTLTLASPASLSSEARAAGLPTDDAYDARRVCDQLGIRHLALDARAEFERCVVSRFVDDYEGGLTPNPCVVCNRLIKFGLLDRIAREHGCDLLATGHYARVSRDGCGAGEACVRRGADAEKDQSYFLYPVPAEVLDHVTLPLGGLTKAQVRALAAERGLPTARRRESQDICFVPDGDYPAWLERRRGAPLEPGAIVDEAGRRLGRHQGLARYTIGQRKGLDVAVGERIYVLDKDADSNELVVGPNEALMRDGFDIAEVVWAAPWREAASAGEPFEAEVVACYHGTPHRARVIPTGAASAHIEAEAPFRAPAPGQSAVAYVGDCVAAGGVIARP
jgi:tRNA-specific 2-thiouridylase